MNNGYRLYLGGNFYCQENGSTKQESLKTQDWAEPKRLIHARNEAADTAEVNYQIA